jgi:hypothetical protein
MAVGRKGIVLTLDALFALALLLLSTVLILILLSRPIPLEAYGFEPASDLMGAMRTVSMAELAANPRYPYAASVAARNLTDPYNASVADSIGELFLTGRAEEAGGLAREFLGDAVPANFGVELMMNSGPATPFSYIYARPGSASKNFVGVDRHLIYYNGVEREMRLVIYR